MDSNDIIRSTVLLGLGFVMTSSTDLQNKFTSQQVDDVTKPNSNYQTSSTRFNNQERFSLEQLKQNKRRLNVFRNLQDGWNGYNGKNLSTDLIEKIELLLASLDYQPQVFPTGRNSIQLEKFIDEDNLIEIEISDDEVFAYQILNGEENEEQISFDKINEYIGKLYH